MHPRKIAALAAGLALIGTTPIKGAPAENDPIDLQLRTELQALQAAFERNVQAKKAEAVRKYEARREEAIRAKKTDLVNELNAKIAALKSEPAPKPVAAPPPSAVELRVLGNWVLENAQGGAVADMMIEKVGDDLFRLTRDGGGGALAVNGSYKLQGDRLVKVPSPGDAYSDLAWRMTGSRLKLTEGQYKDWTLNRRK